MWNVYMRRMHICMKCICAFHAYVHGIYSKYMRAGKEGISEIIRIGVHISAVSERHKLFLKLFVMAGVYGYGGTECLKESFNSFVAVNG
jgi:hypothetical protein